MQTYKIWHPFTPLTGSPQPLKVKSGHGAILEMEDGTQLIDCISSWWVNLHGHAHERIVDAIHQQARKLEHVIFADFTHEPAERLARELTRLMPPGLTNVYFSDNGSTAVEVAIKLAHQYWHNLGEGRRSKFIIFEGGYHGDTVGAMSVGRSSIFWKQFEGLMFSSVAIPFPYTFEGDRDVEKKESLSLGALHELLQAGAGEYAGIIIEPLIQGAGGMRMCRSEFMRALVSVAREFNAVLIFDEVMTGFGRTGDWFASTKCQVAPDIICLSKGLTGGFLPMGATILSNRILSAFESNDIEQMFFHGHSYTANPICCAAAIASLELLRESPHRFRHTELVYRRLVTKYLAGSANIERMRFCGTVMAFDVSVKASQAGYFSTIGKILKSKFTEAGLLLRPLGNTVYLMPPYCVSEETLEYVFLRLSEILPQMP